MVELAHEPERPQSTGHLAGRIGCSEAHLSKVLQRLGRASYVEAIRGPGGGYRLALAPEAICMLHVFELLGGPFIPEGCNLGHAASGSPCLIGAMMDELTISLRDYLATKSLRHLLRYQDLAPEIHIGVLMNHRSSSDA